MLNPWLLLLFFYFGLLSRSKLLSTQRLCVVQGRSERANEQTVESYGAFRLSHQVCPSPDSVGFELWRFYVELRWLSTKHELFGMAFSAVFQNFQSPNANG